MEQPDLFGGEPMKLMDVPSTKDSDVEAVWAYYCDANTPVQTELTDSRRRLILAALKVATVDEIKLAIAGNRASSWHRERNRHALGDVLRPNRQRGETIRDRIDRFHADAERAGHKGFAVRDRARVERAKDLIVYAADGEVSDTTRERVEAARAWLAEQGIETVYQGGWPRFVERR